MDSDAGKLFIGGVSWETTEERLREHFSKYGEVSDAVVMRDKATGKPRGFAFVAFADPSVLDAVLSDPHSIDGRTVDAKRALSREEQQVAARSGNPIGGRTVGGGTGNVRTKKIFVGGLPSSITEEEFRQYFETYGNVTDVVVMYDQNTQRPRGFGFISFDDEDAVDRVLHKTFHELSGKLVEVKRALPKDANSSSGGGRSTGGGSYQSYGGSSANPSSYDGRMDGSRFAQSQAGGGGSYPSYGSSGYGVPGYGYGATNNGVPYGGYGVGGYGDTPAGFGGAAGAYGNPSAPTTAYGSGPPGAQRSLWNNHASSGYSSGGYATNAGYGAAGTWHASAGSGGVGISAAGQSPGGTSQYGSQGYGYGGYGGAEGPYSNQGGFGAVGGRSGGPTGNSFTGTGEQGPEAGYMGSGYGDAGAGSGYASTWRSDPSQGGYGASQANALPGGSGAYGAGFGG